MSVRRWHVASDWVARGLLCAVFVAAGAPKLMDPLGFAASIENYHLLPGALVPVAAVALPVLELCIAAALLVPRLARGACTLGIVLLLLFSAAMLQAMARQIDLDCGCFGKGGDQNVSLWSVGRNVMLCALAGWSLWIAHVSQRAAPSTLTES